MSKNYKTRLNNREKHTFISILIVKIFVVLEFLVNSRFLRIEKEIKKKQISIGMKKIILSLAAVLAFTLTSDAQTRKGTVLLGAGSEMSGNEWTTLAITPKVGYFVQDGVAIGAIVNFQTNNQDKNAYELNNSLAEIGVFGRYYVSNNLFSEISLSSYSKADEIFEAVQKIDQAWTMIPNNGDQENLVAPGTPGATALFDAVGQPVLITYSTDGNPDLLEVVETSTTTLNFSLGLGYTIVWREHFAIEPHMNLTFMNGEQKVYDGLENYIDAQDIKGTHFNLGVNFSLFF